MSSGAAAALGVAFFLDMILGSMVFLAGLVLAGLATIPPWPIYTRHPVKWAAPVEKVDAAETTAADAAAASSPARKDASKKQS